MSLQDAKEVEKMLAEVDISKMQLSDRAMMAFELNRFYEKIRPILEKYSSNDQHSFLFKL